MKMFNSYHTFLLLAIALVLAFVVPLKAQDQPQDYLNAHNRVRASVGVGGLVWSETLASYARGYANLRRGDCLLVHSNGPYGESIATDNADISAEQAMSMWVSVRSDYSYDTNTCRAGRECGSYKQVVWRKTLSLGCAKVRCDTGGSFTVCNYDPSGNIPGERPY